MKKILLLVIVTICSTVYSQVSVPNSFSGGGTISASEMNSNFQTLVNEINSMKSEISTLVSDLNTAESTIVSLDTDIVTLESSLSTAEGSIITLESDLSAAESLISSNTTSLTNIEIFPIGSIVSSILPPTEFEISMGSDWVLSDGRTATTEYFNAFGDSIIPDLRGMFLRGLNEGRSDGKEDPNGGVRVAADFQEDAFQEFGLSVRASQGGAMSGGVGFDGGAASVDLMIMSFIEKHGNGVPRISSETRPKNAAVYYYIKVK